MINELYVLSRSMDHAHVTGRAQHRSYLPLPNVTAKAPCIQILLSEQTIVHLGSLSSETASSLRKYGNNQGSYPAMNLAPLYRITDPQQIQLFTELRNGKATDYDVPQLKSWCSCNNWNAKFSKKFKNCFKKIPEELQAKLNQDPDNPIHLLIEQTTCFQDPTVLHQALETLAFQMLEQKQDIPTAIQLLFYCGKSGKTPEEDFGTLSVIFDSVELTNSGFSTISTYFTDRLNAALLDADSKEKSVDASDLIDAFGVPFAALEEPMPSVKLAGGFEATLRTMFKGQPCQSRYGKIENASYPISPHLRTKLQSALNWISSAEQKDRTWISLNKDEILFAYSTRLPTISPGLAAAFHRTPETGNSSFSGAAKRFLECLKQPKDPDIDSRADQIEIFVLRKLDKARVKIVYTHNTTPADLEQRSEAWYQGCYNLPELPFKGIPTLFPLDVTPIMNQVWKQNAALASDKFKPFHSYHGLELLFDDGSLARQDLAVLLRNLEPAAAALGRFSDEVRNKREKFGQSFLLLGLLLHRLGSRKEQYMQSYPYLYGQLLKVSDELHVMYCRAVRRDGLVPPQLVGGSFFHSAAELPMQTLAQLGQRMNPYIVWAKSYQYQNIVTPKLESWRARWYLSLYEAIASQLLAQPEPKARFNDVERAQLFLGYLAAFPKKEKQDEQNGGTEDEI